MAFRPRLSIRYKTLIVISTVLVVAICAYLYLAITLFRQDKEAYVYDVTSALVGTLSEEVGSNLRVLGDKLSLLGREVLAPDVSEESREVLMDTFLGLEPDVVQVELYQLVGDEYRPVMVRAKAEHLDDLSITVADLQEMRQARPVPLTSLEAAGTFVQNASLPPDAALLTVALPIPSDDGVARAVVADIKQDRLLRILGRSAVYRTYLVDGQGAVLVHPDRDKVLSRVSLADRPIVNDALVKEVAHSARRFAGEDGRPLLGAYSRVGVAGTAVVTEISMDEAFRATQELIRRSILFGAAIILAAFVASVFFSRRLTLPILRLQAATQQIGEGAFDVEIDVKSRDEIGDLADAIRDMTRALAETEAQMVQSQKLAAVAQLGTGLAEEIQKPLSAVAQHAKAARQHIHDPLQLQKTLDQIRGDAERCAQVISDFLKYVHAEHAAVAPHNLNDITYQCLKHLAPRLDAKGVRLLTHFAPDLPAVLVSPPEIQEVIRNLARNAEEAMPNGGTLTVRTLLDPSGQGVLVVEDTGPGIAPDLRRRVFDPFVTTKGTGVGLGLAIAERIVRNHGGTIAVGEGPEGGASFQVRLPLHHSESDSVVAA